MGAGSYAGAFRIRFVAALTVMYLVVVFAVTLTPTTVDNGLGPYIDRLLNAMHNRGVPELVDYGFIEFSANIVFFVPVGFLLGLLLTYRLQWLAVILGGVLSALIESAQGLLLPGRVSSVADVFANTSGALIGGLVAYAVRLLIVHRDVLVIRDVDEGRRAANGLRVRD